MVEYVIPSFQQFQKLRKLRRAKCRHLTTFQEERHSSAKKQPKRGHKATFQKDEHQLSPSLPVTQLPLEFHQLLSSGSNDIVELLRYKADDRQVANNARRRRCCDEPEPVQTESSRPKAVNFDGHIDNISDETTAQKDKNPTRPSSTAIDIRNKDDVETTTVSRMGRGRVKTATKQQDNQEIDLHESRLRLDRPWFRKKKKTKLKQTQLSFSTTWKE